MSKRKLTRVTATIHHQGLAPGETALVDASDPDVEGLLAGGFLVPTSDDAPASTESGPGADEAASGADEARSSSAASSRAEKAS